MNEDEEQQERASAPVLVEQYLILKSKREELDRLTKEVDSSIDAIRNELKDTYQIVVGPLMSAPVNPAVAVVGIPVEPTAKAVNGNFESEDEIVGDPRGFSPPSQGALVATGTVVDSTVSRARSDAGTNFSGGEDEGLARSVASMLTGLQNSLNGGR